MVNALQAFSDQYAAYGYPVLFLGVLLENAAIPVPGETAVLLAGFLASPAGGSRFLLGWVIGLTMLAAVIGDNLGYWLGRRFARPRLAAGGRFLFLTPATLKTVEGYFERYGQWTVFIARFIAGLRVVGALAAGTAGMKWSRFFLANAAGALAWAVTTSLLGYFFGNSFELLHRWLGRGGLILAGLVLLVIGLPFLARHLRRLTPRLVDGFLRAYVWQGALLAALQVLLVVLLVFLSQHTHGTPLDVAVRDWANRHAGLAIRLFAQMGSAAGILPVAVLMTLAILWQLRRQRRPWQEMACAVWALVACEALGLVVVTLLRHRHVEPLAALTWPFGFAGLIPIRATAVLGMALYLLGRSRTLGERVSVVATIFLIVWAAFSVIGTGRQTVTEALLEVAAGALVLVTAVWWLQGFAGGALKPQQPSG
jgi:membrane protein DedA with SNARE-associated domain